MKRVMSERFCFQGKKAKAFLEKGATNVKMFLVEYPYFVIIGEVDEQTEEKEEYLFKSISNLEVTKEVELLKQEGYEYIKKFNLYCVPIHIFYKRNG